VVGVGAEGAAEVVGAVDAEVEGEGAAEARALADAAAEASRVPASAGFFALGAANAVPSVKRTASAMSGINQGRRTPPCYGCAKQKVKRFWEPRASPPKADFG